MSISTKGLCGEEIFFWGVAMVDDSYALGWPQALEHVGSINQTGGGGLNLGGESVERGSGWS